MSTLVECTGLNKNYGKVTALHDVNLTIESGHIIGLLRSRMAAERQH